MRQTAFNEISLVVVTRYAAPSLAETVNNNGLVYRRRGDLTPHDRYRRNRFTAFQRHRETSGITQIVTTIDNC